MTARKRLALTVIFLPLCLAVMACDPQTPVPTRSNGAQVGTPAASGSVSPDGGDAKAILAGAQPSDAALGSGYGTLRPAISNTLAGTGPGVKSVIFAFACTGQAHVAIRLFVDGKEVVSARGNHTCGTDVFQRSLDLRRPSPVSFDADVTGSLTGGFAYGYWPEKTTS